MLAVAGMPRFSDCYSELSLSLSLSLIVCTTSFSLLGVFLCSSFLRNRNTNRNRNRNMMNMNSSCPRCGSPVQCFGGGSSSSSATNNKKAVKELQRQLRQERNRREAAVQELQREREAVAWASQEAMAKIMQLQIDKAAVERDARHYRQLMEEKQLHDSQLLDYLHLLLPHQPQPPHHHRHRHRLSFS